MNKPSHPALEAAFSRLAKAVQTGDLMLYRSLAANPADAFQMQLFERNSAVIKKDGMRLTWRDAVWGSDGTTATVHFAVLTPGGQEVEAGEMAFVWRDDAWFVQEL